MKIKISLDELMNRAKFLNVDTGFLDEINSNDTRFCHRKIWFQRPRTITYNTGRAEHYDCGCMKYQRTTMGNFHILILRCEKRKACKREKKKLRETNKFKLISKMIKEVMFGT